MFINKLHIKNFKCFKDHSFEGFGIPNGNPGSGLNIFIGENNTQLTGAALSAKSTPNTVYLAIRLQPG